MLTPMIAEAGLAPNFVVGGDVTDAGTGAHWTGRRWLVGRGRRERRHPRRAAAGGTVLTNVEVDHLDHYGTFAALVDELRPYLAPIPGPKVVCIDDPVLRATGRPATTCIDVRAGARRRRARRRRAAARGRSVRRRAPTAVALGDVELPLRGAHNVANATGADRHGARARCAVRRPCAAALARFGGVVRRFDIRGIDGGATLVDDYAHLPAEIAAVLARRPRRAATTGSGWWSCSSRTASTGWSRCRREYADVLRRRRRGRCSPRSTRPATTPIPGVTGTLVVTRSSTPIPGPAWCGCRSGPTSCRSSRARSGRATSASRWAAVTSPRLPEEVLARRRQRGCGVTASGHARRARMSPRRHDAAAACSAPLPSATCRSVRSRRTGSVGRRPCSSRRDARRRPAAVAAAGGRRASPCSWSAGAPTCSSPTPGSRASRSSSARSPGTRPSAGRPRTSTAPAAAGGAPGARPAHGGGSGWPGSSGPSACRARSAARCG